MDTEGAVLRRLIDRVEAARQAAAPLEIRGGGTKRFYGNACRGEPLEVRELCGITSYEPTELTVTALAGTPLAELEAALAQCGQCLPFEPPRFSAGGTVGGMVAAGLSGPARASLGPLRDYVLGVSLLNGMAEMLTFGGQVMKNVAGYDLSRLIAGSLGILGIICEVSLKVVPVTRATRTLAVEIDQAAGLRLVGRLAGESTAMSATSWHDGRLWVRFSGARAAVCGARLPSGGREIDPDPAAAWWSDLRDQRHDFFAGTEGDLERGKCLWRLSVPQMTPPLDLPGEQLIEWGGAQRWLWSTESASSLRALAAAAGGHATLMRAKDRTPGAFSPPTALIMTIHRRLKQAFDPAGIFNPGRLYAEL